MIEEKKRDYYLSSVGLGRIGKALLQQQMNTQISVA